ncbi:hypothetical protein [Rubrobacter calidifluminis]|uniref:hypothetical protein n=1 Tax=Rubrobacter calidifluminis TaxID=1392640 RepID=UPI002362B071|nr:hypothetical protein [Rubrobacter calidifluminis]
MSCEICGGVTTCPGGKYSLVLRPPDEYVRNAEKVDQLPGWTRTHTTGHGKWFVQDAGPSGTRLELVGAKQARRVEAHYGVEPRWVGMCTYAVYVR